MLNFNIAPVAIALTLICSSGHGADDDHSSTLTALVSETVRPLMEDHNIPGVSVALTVAGEQHIFNFGMANTETGKKVTSGTLFEIGSVSKTFTATLGCYAQAADKLSLHDKASKHLPTLAGSRFDDVSLLHLGTYTAGGLPLQFPDSVQTEKDMLAYFQNWKPDFTPGSYRKYSNPSIGLFGYLTAQSLEQPFDNLMESVLFPKLGLKNTFIRVPSAKMPDYAWGYSKDDKPVRVSPGVFSSEAYGVKTTAADLLRFVELNIDSSTLEPNLREAITGTLTGYFKIGNMVQGLGWEMYSYPSTLDILLKGNSQQMIFEANDAVSLTSGHSVHSEVWINKTGSTNGFGAYVAFVPTRRIGIVLLANKNYPIPARVRAAHTILSNIDMEKN